MDLLKAICASALLFLILIGCGGGSSTPPPTPTPTPTPSIVVSPSSATVALSAHQAFTATSNGSPVAVNWSVNGIAGGNSTVGTIDVNGNFTGPASFPSPNTDTVTATLQSDATKTGSASVKVVFPNDNHVAQSPPVKMGTTGGNSTDLVNNGKTITCCSGTLGSLWLRGGTFFILSNNHVLDKSDQGKVGDPITQPGLVDDNCGTLASTTVANLTEAAALKPTSNGGPGCAGEPTPCGPAPSNVDAAIAAIMVGTVDTMGPILDLGAAGTSSIAAAPPSSTLAVPATVLASAEGVAKSGRSTGLTCSTLQAVSTTVSVVYAASCGGATAFTATFSNQVIVNGGSFSAAGDSGSLIVTSDTARPVALLYGGNSTSTSANPIQDVITAFTNGSGTPAIVGAASDHTVSCDPTANGPSASPAPSASFAALSSQERQRVAAVQQRHAAELMRDRAITRVDIGASQDSPGEGALVIHVSGPARAAIPAVIDGVRTKIVPAAPAGSLQMPALSARDMDDAVAVKEGHAAALMAQPGIQGVGVGRSDDNPTETAIVIFVISGVSHPAIPQALDGVRTKIVEGDRFRAFDWGKPEPAKKCGKK